MNRVNESTICPNEVLTLLKTTLLTFKSPFILPYGNLQPVFDVADLTLAKADIVNCRARLPFLVNLTAKQKKAHLDLGKKTKSFITKALNYYRQYPELRTSFVSLTEFENDWETCQRLEELHSVVKVLENDLAHTILALKQESMKSALGLYHNVKKASEYNVPGTDNIIEDLRPMLPGRKKRVQKSKVEKNVSTNINTTNDGLSDEGKD